MQIVNTMQCNFHCAHCLFDCKMSRKEHLSEYMMLRFLDTISTMDEFCNFCGGEIFLNPEWESQLYRVSYMIDHLRIVTNGSMLVTKKGNVTKVGKAFIEFLNSAQCSQIEVLVSDDEFHRAELYDKGMMSPSYLRDRLSIEVWNSNVIFSKDNRDVMRNRYIPLGRAVENNIYDHSGSCLIDPDAPDFSLAPDGKVYACCNLRGYVGECYESYFVWEERFQQIECQESCLQCKLKGYGEEA